MDVEDPVPSPATLSSSLLCLATLRGRGMVMRSTASLVRKQGACVLQGASAHLRQAFLLELTGPCVCCGPGRKRRRCAKEAPVRGGVVQMCRTGLAPAWRRRGCWIATTTTSIEAILIFSCFSSRSLLGFLSPSLCQASQAQGGSKRRD